MSSCGCSGYTRSEALRRGLAVPGAGLPSIEPGMPLPAGTGMSRRSLLLRGEERLVTRPHWYLDAGVEVYATRNQRNDVAYYSPLSERSLLPSLSWNHTLRQTPASAWTQSASVGLGGLTQQGYGGSALGVLSYGQRYRVQDMFEIGGTLSAISRSYDGKREREWRIAFDLIQRF